ncbi:hypothetical protein FHR84_000563 [Actinopolyspora biskrensis]|uniref:Uncharacterized protein n=1 Tax=Actinopolyspora biskrensis TaxID=1470178 RepID=A0A852YUK5_9ACTN|nr:hypothetical protein [Actinopolyspora biskrensis]
MGYRNLVNRRSSARGKYDEMRVIESGVDRTELCSPSRAGRVRVRTRLSRPRKMSSTAPMRAYEALADGGGAALRLLDEFPRGFVLFVSMRGVKYL